jgi:hypothetical protein
MSKAGMLMATAWMVPVVALGQTAPIWEPIEWTYENATYAGNPFDLIASAAFTHASSGVRIATQLYYEGKGDDWKLRFTGTHTGQWTFVTKSDDPDLDGRTGTVDILPNPGAAGFLTACAGGNRWGRLGLDEAFVPQYAMYVSPLTIHEDPGRIDSDLERYFGDHGFNGLHTSVLCAWFDITKETYDQIPSSDPNPDPRTFAALERMIDKAREAGGVVHIWAWGDEQRHMTPAKWGKNGAVDQRLQRYISARLGPLPNWTMGYGFDLQEWVSPDDLRRWCEYMHRHLGWHHYLGARAPDMTQIHGSLDYASYQEWQPSYDTYVRGIETLFAGQPKLFEDRFRVRRNVYPEKDYNLEMTRRGLYHSTMAGGAANIWGYLLAPAPAHGESGVYPNRHELLTASRVFRHRFRKEMVRAPDITDGVCLAVPGSHYIFYKEDTASIRMDLARLSVPAAAVAIDARDDYEELPLGVYEPGSREFAAPRTSDWVVVVGDPEPPASIRIDLGRIDAESGLYRVENCDGNTRVVDLLGRNCRTNRDPDADRYIYFNIAGSYAHEGSRPEIQISIEFHDSGKGTLSLEYDGATGAYTRSGAVDLTDTGAWRRHTFSVTHAHCGNRQNNGADFRIAADPGRRFYLDRLEVSHPVSRVTAPR